MKLQQLRAFISIPFIGILFLGTACHKSNSATANTNDTARTSVSQYVSVDGRGVYYVTNLPGDTTASAAMNAAPVYFSLTTNGTVESTQAGSTSWDVAFTSLYNSYVTCNSGSILYSPGYGGQGQGAIWVVNQSFDSVTSVPPAAPDSTGSAGLTGYPGPGWVGWYNYNQTTHILTPINGITLVIKTATGKYAKLEMLSLYKDNPANPTLSTPVPYLTFKYWLQKDGSTNLSTK